MIKIKTTLFILALFLIPATTASAIETEFYPENTTVTPGQSNIVGYLEVQNNDTLRDFNYETTLEANTSIQNTTSETDAFNVTLTSFPEKNFPVGSETGEITVSSNNGEYTGSEEVTLEITEYSEWSVTGFNQTRNLSVGSDGIFNDFTIYQAGNTESQVNVNITGNLTQILNYRDTFTARPSFNQSYELGYQIPSTQGFGYYNATLTLEGGNQSQRFNLSTMVVDGIKPEIQRVEVPDTVMATTQPRFELEASDNLDVVNVTGHVYKTGENETWENFRNISFNHVENTDRFRYDYSNTLNRGDYRVNITVRDESGNIDYSLQNFTIERLNATQVVNDNFEFDDIWPEDQIQRHVITQDVESPATFKLASFDYGGDKDDIKVGVLGPGDETPDNFRGENGTVSIEETGEYELVVQTFGGDSLQAGRYTGEIQIETVDQHVKNLSSIDFAGEAKSGNIPKPECKTLGEFRGCFFYPESSNMSEIENHLAEQGNDTSQRYAAFAGRVPIEDVRGYGDFNQFTTYDLGEIRRQNQTTFQTQQENKRLRAENTWVWIGSILLVVLSTGGNLLERKIRDYWDNHLIYRSWDN